MREINNEERIAAFSHANPTIQNLWSSEESGEKLRSIFTTHSLSGNLYRSYTNVVGDVILGFHQQGELPQLLKTALGIDDTRAIRLTADLLDFLEPLNHQSPVVADALPPTIASEIAQAEAALEHVSNVRTMARDMEDLKSQAPHEAPAYKSSQDTLRPGAPKASGNRWESE